MKITQRATGAEVGGASQVELIRGRGRFMTRKGCRFFIWSKVRFHMTEVWLVLLVYRKEVCGLVAVKHAELGRC